MKPSRVTFAARRRKAQDDLIATLEPIVGRALDRKQAGSDTWWRPIIDAAHPMFDSIVRDEGGNAGKAAGTWALTSLDLVNALTKTKRIDEYSHTVIATLVAGALLSAGTYAAALQGGEPFELEWVSMHDTKVRHTHKVADGQRVKPGDKFSVGGVPMRWPLDTRAPISEWINCRCTVAATPVHHNAASTGHTDLRPTTGETMNDTLVAAATGESIPWHGVLAPEGVWSGDRRRFAPDSLSHRDLPLPLTHQVAQDDGHKGAVTVASIDWMQKRGNLMHAGGRLLQSSEADDLVGVMAHFGRIGVSIDGDMAEGGFADEDGNPFDLERLDKGEDPYGESYDKIRICSAAACNIPAFEEAYIQLGVDPDYVPDEPSLAAAAVNTMSVNVNTTTGFLTGFDWGKLYLVPASIEEAAVFASISEKSWDGSASRFTPEQWKRSCTLHLSDSVDKADHKLPIREPDGALSRAGVHAAAGRVDQVDAPDDKKAAAKRAIRSAYTTLGEDPPESLALVATFAIEDVDPHDFDDLAEDEQPICAHGDCEATPTKAVSTDTPNWFVLYCADHAAEHEDKPLSDLAARSVAIKNFGRGPGWITNPEDTKRIHDYWTVPGQPGYEKIAWGTDGDFNRCRLQVGEEIAENSPDKTRFLNQICAQWHHDATGFWPGHAPAETSMDPTEGEQAPAISLVASASTVLAPAEWFTNPEFTELTPLTIGEDGHIFGHLADWNTCHMNYATPGQCINPPRSASGYAYFRHGEVLTDKGPVATGPLTLTTGHAPDRMRMRAALAHYDNTGTAVADVAAYDDQFGIAVNGWVRPWVSEEKIYELRASSLSGDWRRDPNSGQMEMIAALGVNSPGFPVRRFGYDEGVQVSMVASLTNAAEAPVADDGLEELAERIAAKMDQRAARRHALEELSEVFD